MPTRGFVSLSVKDYDGEIATVDARVAQITSGNFNGGELNLGLFYGALQAVSLGTLQHVSWGNVYVMSASKPADAQAQRELKWLVSYHDVVTLERFSFTIPCADPGHLDPLHRAYADIVSNGHPKTFVSGAQGFLKSPRGNAIIVDSMKLVGRAL